MKTVMPHTYPGVITNTGEYACLSMFYDKYAGALYGIIVQIVDKEIIASKVLELSFKNRLEGGPGDGPKLVSAFTSLSNRVRKKSHETVKAITIFEACNNGWKCVPA
jgi:hypothetical protein